MDSTESNCKKLSYEKKQTEFAKKFKCLPQQVYISDTKDFSFENLFEVKENLDEIKVFVGNLIASNVDKINSSSLEYLLGNLKIENSNVTLGRIKKIIGDVVIINSKVPHAQYLDEIEGNLTIKDSEFVHASSLKTITKDLLVDNANITDFDCLENIGKSFHSTKSSITWLSSLKTIGNETALKETVINHFNNIHNVIVAKDNNLVQNCYIPDFCKNQHSQLNDSRKRQFLNEKVQKSIEDNFKIPEPELSL